MNHFRSAWILLGILLLSAPAWADELKTLSGKSLSGTLEKITDSAITLKAGGKSAETPLAQVLELTLRPGKSVPSANRYIEVQLLDESILYCTKVTFGAKDVQLELTSGAVVKAPLTALVTVLRDAQDENVKKQWAKLLTEKIRYDRIFVLKDGDLNPLKGALGAIDETKQSIKFKIDGGAEIEAQLDNVQGMQFVRTDLPTDVSLCKVIDIDGNVVVASKLGYSGDRVNVTTPFGQKLAFDPKHVARVDFNFGRLTYLSDLDANTVDAPLLGGFNPVRKDRNLDDGPIMLQEKKYDKGLSMYAGVELTYNLAGKYKDFKALLGADSRIAEEGQGKVTVTIYCDREKRSTFEVSTKAPMPIAVNVKDVTTLKIVVSGSNLTNYSGHATLANALVSQ
jgi:NPCBM/NEW2 domain